MIFLIKFYQENFGASPRALMSVYISANHKHEALKKFGESIKHDSKEKIYIYCEGKEIELI
jgi:uncharacterized protein YlbG (UPF0298 family)